MSDLDFRPPLDLQKLVTGHVLLWPEDLRAYWDAGLTVEDFADGDLRIVWTAIARLDADSVAPDERTVRNVVSDRVPASFLSSLVDGVPRQRHDNIRHHVEELSRLRRCRAFARGEQIALEQLAARPELIDNGFLAHRREAIDALQRDAPEPELLVDDVALLELPAPACLIERRIVARTQVAIVGPPGTGKTCIAVDLGMCVATGRPWLGARVVRPGPVVYIAAEGAPGLQPRVRAWKVSQSISLTAQCNFFLYPRALNLLEPRDVERFLRATRRIEPVLVVVDTLARCMVGGDENSSADMGRVIAAADRLREELGATIVFLHHTTKAGGTERGSSALRGALDTLLALNPADDLLSLNCEKQKDLAPFAAIDLRLDLVDDSCVIRSTRQSAAPAREALTAAQERCLAALRDSFARESGATATEWKAAVPDVNERTFFRAVKVLIDRGFVRKVRQRHVWSEKAGSEQLTLTDRPTDSPTDTATDIRVSEQIGLVTCD